MSVRIIVDDLSKPIANYPNKLHILMVLGCVETICIAPFVIRSLL